MTGWDDILLKLTEKNQSETQIKNFFEGDDILSTLNALNDEANSILADAIEN